jgi:hypothetical protein
MILLYVLVAQHEFLLLYSAIFQTCTFLRIADFALPVLIVETSLLGQEAALRQPSIRMT